MIEEPLGLGPIAVGRRPPHLVCDTELDQRGPDLGQHGQPVWRERGGDGFEFGPSRVRLAGGRQGVGDADPRSQ